MSRLAERMFHLICNKNFQWSSSYNEHSFEAGFASTEVYFHRLGGNVDVRDKTVLDVGCGVGMTCIYAAQHGAKEVLGIDIDELLIGFANQKLRSDYSDLATKVSFKTVTGPNQLAGRKFDIILSKDSFEHIADPQQYLTALRDYVADDGMIVIGFGPLWKSPYGGHIKFMTKLPWAHLIFSERVIMRERRVLFNPPDQAETFAQVRGGMNKMTLRKFRLILDHSGLEPMYLKMNAHEGLWAKVCNVLRYVPFCEEYFTFNLYSIWQLKQLNSEHRLPG